MTPRPPKAKAIERIQKALDQIAALQQIRYDSPVFMKWRRDTVVALTHTFGEDSTQAKSFARIRFRASALPMIVDREVQQPYIDKLEQASYVEGLISASALLSSMLDEIKEYWPDKEIEATSIIQESQEVIANRVFVVHGRDEGAKDKVARFIDKLRLEPIVLAEQPSQGLTIIEKFERHANVAFAVVLMTPDDTGSLRGQEDSGNPRARQNVIFELGFFIGKLGRERVCVLTRGDVEIPSDYSGVVYIPLDDAEGWKFALIRELRKAELDVDANQAL